jgi:hypothetical protein
VKWGREIGWYGIDTWNRVGLGMISVHVGSLLRWGLLGVLL